MIKFSTVTNKERKIVAFTVQGHSGLSESGTDILCAAVSTAVWMTINGIEKQNLADISYVQEDGFVECRIPEERESAADALLNSLVYIMSELSAQYKKNLFITRL